MRFRLSRGEESSVYRPGNYVSGTYAARYPHKVSPEEPEETAEEEERKARRVERRLERMEEIEEMEFGDVWEFTLTYKED